MPTALMTLPMRAISACRLDTDEPPVIELVFVQQILDLLGRDSVGHNASAGKRC